MASMKPGNPTPEGGLPTYGVMRTIPMTVGAIGNGLLKEKDELTTRIQQLNTQYAPQGLDSQSTGFSFDPAKSKPSAIDAYKEYFSGLAGLLKEVNADQVKTQLDLSAQVKAVRDNDRSSDRQNERYNQIAANSSDNELRKRKAERETQQLYETARNPGRVDTTGFAGGGGSSSNGGGSGIRAGGGGQFTGAALGALNLGNFGNTGIKADFGSAIREGIELQAARGRLDKQALDAQYDKRMADLTLTQQQIRGLEYESNAGLRKQEQLLQNELLEQQIKNSKRNPRRSGMGEDRAANRAAIQERSDAAYMKQKQELEIAGLRKRLQR